MAKDKVGKWRGLKDRGANQIITFIGRCPMLISSALSGLIQPKHQKRPIRGAFVSYFVSLYYLLAIGSRELTSLKLLPVT